MNDLDTLLRAVIAAPDEDTPRLAYADAAQEAGDEARAEFIRVQCELARLEETWAGDTRKKRHARRTELRRREQELWRAKIHTPLVQIENPNYCAWLCCGTCKEDHPNVWLQTWRRGFCEEIRYDAANFLAMADHLIWHPSQVADCPKCCGHKKELHRVSAGVNIAGDKIWQEYETRCENCGGTGRVHRPCPPTAQPIRKVVLTTAPEVHLERFDGSGPLATIDVIRAKYQPHHESVSDMIRELFRREFGPGVEFELPTVANWEQGDDPDPVILRDLRNMAEQIRRETTGRVT
jgi:uncharacterized protein (TIGR02996 family)